MKNIHILKTNKPSRLGRFIDTNNLFIRVSSDIPRGENVNIYITSDEEIKEGDYVYSTAQDYNMQKVSKGLEKSYNDVEHYKKIILTTDQDLIKNGVQAIDDEFLEWFVNNSNCEEVEVKHNDIIQYGNMTMYDHNGDGSYYFCKDCEVETSRSKEELLKLDVEYYKITIPKEEPKSNIERLPFPELVKEFAEYYKDIPLVEEAKQETLEEVAERFIKESDAEHYISIEDFLLGVKSDVARIYWQQKQDNKKYSEEEVLKLLISKEENTKDSTKYNGIEYLTPEEWFEQFKKK